MSSTIVNLIIQLIAGVVGGNAAGKSLSDYDLGAIGNTIAGAIGGVGGGQILQALIPPWRAQPAADSTPAPLSANWSEVASAALF